MKSQTLEVHSCDFCNKKLFVKGMMKRHEDNCKRNPKNWAACHECEFKKLVKKPIINSFDRRIDVDSYYCSKLKKEIHPHKAVRKGLVKKYSETFANSVLMPTKCKDFIHEKQSDYFPFKESKSKSFDEFPL